MDDLLQQTKDLIAHFGWAVRHVGEGADASAPGITFTVGLTALGHPEVVITGMPFEGSSAFLNYIGDLVKGGRRFEPATMTHDLTDVNMVGFITASELDELEAVAEVYPEFEALQMVWSDRFGKFPWEPGFGNPPGSQRLLGDLPPEWMMDDQDDER